jgi:hypothetical protein
MSEPKRVLQLRMRRPSWPTVVQLRALLVFALPGLLAACSSSGGSANSTTAPSGPQASAYFVSGAQGWTTKQAYKPAPDDPIASRAEPTLDWSAQHERNPPTNPTQSVRLSGHRVSMGKLQETLAGFEFRSRLVMRKEGQAGSGPDGPRVVLVPASAEYTIMTLSYELGLDELVEWSNALRLVDEAGWVAAGGIIAR